jgi:xanthosine phosphorylase
MSYRGAAAYIKSRLNGFEPSTAVVLGSGLGGFAEKLSDQIVVEYRDIPDFPQSTVVGHSGRFVFGHLLGKPVVCMQGRLHFYEGHDLSALAVPVRAMRLLGVETLVLTNAAGSLRTEVGPGRIMLITDHINFVGVNPLIGENDDTIGPRFFDVSKAYDPTLQSLARQLANKNSIDLAEGVYAWYSGPNFETPAEIRAMKTLGSDAVGMSTVPECLVAVHSGMRVAAFSIITNLAAGMSKVELSHEETLSNAATAEDDLSLLLTDFISGLTAV